MSTLADSFLEDLDDLEDSDDDGNEEEVMVKTEDDEDGPDLDNLLGDIHAGGDISSVISLRASPAFREQMERIEASLERPAEPIVGSVEENPEYQLIVSCNDFMQRIDEEMLTVYKYVSGMYSKKFPELESLVPGRLEYLKTLQQIGNEMDMTMVDLAAILPNAVVISVSMTGSTTSGQPLSESDLAQCLQGCEEALALDASKNTILHFVETRMTAVAPNVCAILDTVIAAQLMGLTGGLVGMSKMPACNLQVVGQQKNLALSGFGAAAALKHTGLVYYSSVVQQAPPYLRMKALKVTAGKLALAARIDMHQSEPSGDPGMKLRAEIDEKIAKWQEPQQAHIKHQFHFVSIPMATLGESNFLPWCHLALWNHSSKDFQIACPICLFVGCF